jgi:hypothetical protein
VEEGDVVYGAGAVPPVEANYGTTEAARLVDQYAGRVLELLRERQSSGEYALKEMLHNNPGFDVSSTTGPKRDAKSRTISEQV